MLKTQFQFEQAQRKKSLDNELASESTFDKFTEYLAAASSSGEINFSTPEGREMYSDLKTSVEPNISRDPATWKRYEAFSKEFENKEGFPVFKEQERKILMTGLTWDQNNLGNPRPQIKDAKTGELVDNNKLMADQNFEVAIKRKQREADLKYGGGGMSQFYGSKPSELSPGVRERYIIDRNNFFNKATATKDNEQIVEASSVWSDSPSQSESESLDKYKFTTERLSELSNLLKNEKTGPMVGFWRQFKSGLGFDDKALLIKAQITKIIPGLARGVFNEVGVLTDQDVAMYARTIGNLNTPEEVNKALTEAAMDMVARGFENKLSTLAKSRKNVSGYLDQLKDVKKQSQALLGVEDEEPEAIEVESFTRDGNTVSISDEDAARIEAAAGNAKTISVREAGTDNIIKINVRGNPPTGETPPAPTSEPVAAPMPKPDKPIEDFSVWSGKHLEDFPPLSEAEAKKVSPNRRKWEARLELYETRLAELVAAKRGRISQTADEKKLRKRIAEAEAELKKL
tara:strand:- start:34 stop:1578 length:1545 start_codon:yes stop_codon:yes gene_type:complete